MLCDPNALQDGGEWYLQPNLPRLLGKPGLIRHMNALFNMFQIGDNRKCHYD